MPDIAPQKKQILEQLAAQAGWRDYKELAKESDPHIAAKVYRAQLGKLETDTFAQREEDTANWVITEAGAAALKGILPAKEEKGNTSGEQANKAEEKAAAEKAAAEEKERGTDRSLESQGLTEYQIFIDAGKTMGGMVDAKVAGIAKVVFGDDAYDLDKVWINMSEMGVAIDLRKQWFKMWQSHLKQGGKPSTVSPGIQSQITPADKRNPEEMKAAVDQGRSWDLVSNDAGMLETERIGDGLGEYTFAEATQLLALRNRATRQTTQAGSSSEPITAVLEALAPYLVGSQDKGNAQKESLAELITALKPFLKPEAKNGTEEGSVVQMILKSKLEEMANTKSRGVTGMLEDLPKTMELIKGLAPIIRAALGVPEPGTSVAAAPSTAIALQDKDGNPMRIDLNAWFQIQEFNANMKREDEAAKGKSEFIKTTRGFLQSLGEAAVKAAQQQ